MVIKIDELRKAEFIDEWENGFGWIAKPEENMMRTSHAFVDDGVYLVDPVDAENLDDKISEFGEVGGIIILFSRHVRDSVELAGRYDCPVYVPEWFERELDAEVRKISEKVPGTDWEIHTVINSKVSKEAALYHRGTKSLIVADSLGTARHLCGRGEKLGMSPLYRFNPPHKLLDFEPERIFCGHGEGVTENATETMKETIRKGRRKTLSAYFNAFYKMFKG
ncbi:hypothetical protein [Candidatus Nanohalobium constans]|uniref:MBL fold metallo-hydrolase n=1 Tax=Candidatus Nanohalobium constans TaxID=2565781 RepID=A0A5Q0UGL9_9ARCH|nr:hypothetical protein [Candidatus Nanohalobium constans]QGA80521.1 hypothetical protein LC1Nh_0628 [Candidatus Nanohalobium constans]